MTMLRLSDDQMRGFIRDGFLAIKTGLSAEANQNIWDKTEALFEREAVERRTWETELRWLETTTRAFG